METCRARILLIDDDDSVRYTLKLMLERGKFEVEEATNGQNGFEKFKQSNYDLVITDVFMPEKDGLELVKDLKKFSPTAKVIVISGNHEQPQLYLKVAALMQADATLQKPFSMQKLLETVELVLGK